MSLRVFGARSRVLPTVLVAVAALLIVAWAGAAVATSGSGFDITDEGFYLLSYRWWDSTPRTFTGVQYLYGPVFELLGYSVRGLRIFRLLTVLAAHAAFAWAFVSWWAQRRPDAFPGSEWRWVAGLAIVATGGIAYGWMPLSPAYNDVAALSSLAMLAALLRALRGVDLSGRLPMLPAVTVGPLIVALVFAKWASAGVILAFLGTITVIAIRATRASGGLHFAGVVAVSAAASAVVMDLVIGGFSSTIPPIVEVNRLVAQSTNSPVELLGMYLRSGGSLLIRSLGIIAPASVILAACQILRRRGRLDLARLGVALSPAVAPFVAAGHFGLPTGGASGVRRYTACLVALGALAAAAALVTRRRRPRRAAMPNAGSRVEYAAVYVALLVLPVVQAMGTGNPVYYLAVNLMSAWMALLVVLATTTPGLARVLVIAASTTAVVLSAEVGVTGLIDSPFRTAPLSRDYERVGGAGPVAPLHVSADEARRFAAVRAAVGPTAPGQPMMAFDELAGIILLLDGRSVGEAWYSALDRRRSASGIREACVHGNPWGARQPIIFFDRSPSATDRAALAACHLSLDTNFRRAEVAGFHPALRVYLPVDRRNAP